MARRTGASPGGRRDTGTSHGSTAGRRRGGDEGAAPADGPRDGGGSRGVSDSRGGGPRGGGPAGGGQQRPTETGGTPVAAARASQLTKVYGSGDTIVTALRGIDIGFPRGRFTAIMGPSGSGKSTLMHCLAGLDTITRGRVFIGDVDLSRLSDKELTRLRRDRIGFIFQQFNLLPTLTAQENITLPLSIAGRSPDREWMRTVVDAVGLAPRLAHRPTELSGGQQQRVACARALVTKPEIIFADEPTGNLDSRSGAEVLGFLRDSVTELGQTIVMVTHDATAASYSDEVIFLADGRLVDSLQRPTADEVLDRMKHLDAAQRGLIPGPSTDEHEYAPADDAYSNAAADYGPNPPGHVPNPSTGGVRRAERPGRRAVVRDGRGPGTRPTEAGYGDHGTDDGRADRGTDGGYGDRGGAREADGYDRRPGDGYGRAAESYGAEPAGYRGAPAGSWPEPVGHPTDPQAYDPTTGGYPTGGYGTPGTGGYGDPSTGGYGASPGGGYGASPGGGYGGPPSGSYDNPPTGGYSTPPTGGYPSAWDAGFGAAPESYRPGPDGYIEGDNTGGYLPYPDQRHAERSPRSAGPDPRYTEPGQRYGDPEPRYPEPGQRFAAPDARYTAGGPPGNYSPDDHARGYVSERGADDPGGVVDRRGADDRRSADSQGGVDGPPGEVGELYRDTGQRRRRSGGSQTAGWA
ncbi:ATP-binding cassette domain-containing protein [Frankia sp. R82]|uniref:ATP-binding cassette domain-containing protein n=1 Tax=Frankia sp. R82 TaxID=2950553 RepID=UPI00255B0F7A|nr:ATP-binding cassette domain-containing protein [Frankia sp. R82]